MTTTKSRPTTAPVSFEFAENIFRRGTDFLHNGLVADSLKLSLPEPPPIPFTSDKLTAAKSRGEQLIWYPAKDTDDKPITMKSVYDRLRNKATLGGRLLCNTDWYAKNEEFFTTDTVRIEKRGLGSWRLVGTQAVPGTKGINYLEQTIIAANFVRDEIYGGNPPDPLIPILAEPKERETEIAKLMDTDWQQAAKILANMGFNREFRDSPVEAFIRVIVNQHVNKIRLLENEWSWTNFLSRDGLLVAFGDADAYGAYVFDWLPRDANGDTGFFLSRSEIGNREP